MQEDARLQTRIDESEDRRRRIHTVERLSTGPNPCAYDACFSDLLAWDQALMAPSSVTWRISFLARLIMMPRTRKVEVIP